MIIESFITCPVCFMSPKDRSLESLLEDYLKQTLAQQKKANKHAKKRNTLAKRELTQTALNYEQAERLYLLEKSKLQPSFKLSVTEFLLCEPSSMNDPEQSAEAHFLSQHSVCTDERVLRFSVNMKAGGNYLRPHLVIQRDDITAEDDLALPLHDLLYFLPHHQLSSNEHLETFVVYFIYADQTTLPVLHKYQVTQSPDDDLRRWNAVHVDTVYAMSHHKHIEFAKAQDCAALFKN